MEITYDEIIALENFVDWYMKDKERTYVTVYTRKSSCYIEYRGLIKYTFSIVNDKILTMHFLNNNTDEDDSYIKTVYTMKNGHVVDFDTYDVAYI